MPVKLPKAQGTNEYIVNISFTSIYCHLGCPAALTHPPRPARISCPKARNAENLQNFKDLKNLNRVGGGWLGWSGQIPERPELAEGLEDYEIN